MASRTTYICDWCKKPVRELHGALFVTIRGEKEDTTISLELCGYSCLKLWLGVPKTQLKIKRPRRKRGDPETDMSQSG